MNLAKLIVLFIAFLGMNHPNVYAQKFEWAIQLESLSNQLVPSEIAVDSEGNSYITGYFTGISDFNPAGDVFIDTAGIQGQAFVAKYSPSGNFAWAKFLKGGPASRSFGLAIEVQGDKVYVGGGFSDDVTDFDPGPGVFNVVPVNFDPYILHLDTAGNFVNAIQFGSFTSTGAQSLVQDLTITQSGDVIAVGRLSGSLDFDPGAGVDSLASSGDDDIFVCKLDANLNHQWAQRFGSTDEDQAYGVAVDPDENVYFTGCFSGLVDFDPGANTSNLIAFNTDIYVAKLTPQGDFSWVRQLGGTSDEQGQSIAADSSGGIYAAGTFRGSIDFDPGPGSNVFNAGTYYNAFICKFDTSGNYQWAYQVGDGSFCRGFDVTTDILNDVYFTGDFTGITDLNLGPQTELFETASNFSSGDVFLMKLTQTGDHIWAKQIGSPGAAQISYGVAVDSAQTLYSTGTFGSTVDFNTGEDTLLFSAPPGNDLFIHKMSKCSQTYSSISEVACGSYLPPSGKILYTQSGIYNDVIDNAQGCDSVITIDLTIVALPQPSQINVSITNCDYYVSPSGNYTLDTSGVYSDTLSNAFGCDSIIIINLTSNITFTAVTENACVGYTSPSGNDYWTNSGIYYDTLASIAGCDSIIEIDLIVSTPTSAAIDIFACDQYISPSGNQVWTTDGTYQDTILNANNCDSILVVNFQLLNSSSSQNVTACGGYLSPSGNNYWTTPGIYVDTIQNGLGCDSVITFDVAILPTDSVSINISTCDEYLSPSGLHVWDSTGIYFDTLSNINGCDSIITVNLEILNSSSTQNITSCDGYMSPSGVDYWTSSGVYLDTIQNTNGCDSVVTTVLTIDPIVVTVNQINFNTILASPTTGSYQWVDCLNGMSMIAGETGQFFTAAANGSYAVVVTEGTCTDTSDCVLISEVGLVEEDLLSTAIVYPNPTSKDVIVELLVVSEGVEIIVRNVLGEVTFTEQYNESEEIMFECVGPSGCYTIEIVTDRFRQFHRIVKL